jgi:hypothetical protein
MTVGGKSNNPVGAVLFIRIDFKKMIFILTGILPLSHSPLCTTTVVACTRDHHCPANRKSLIN